VQPCPSYEGASCRDIHFVPWAKNDAVEYKFLESRWVKRGVPRSDERLNPVLFYDGEKKPEFGLGEKVQAIYVRGHGLPGGTHIWPSRTSLANGLTPREVILRLAQSGGPAVLPRYQVLPLPQCGKKQPKDGLGAQVRRCIVQGPISQCQGLGLRRGA
jgi:hypothetical protein